MYNRGCGARRYHLTTLGRFLLVSLPLLLVLMGLFSYGVEALGFAPSTSELAVLGLERSEPLPPQLRLGGWLVETLALTALFLLIQGKSGAWWLDGLVAAAIAWVFRGPVLVLSVVSVSRLGSDPWWPMSLHWLVLYALCGLALAISARALGVRR